MSGPETVFRYPNGDTAPPGICHTIQGSEDVFTISIRSMSGIEPGRIKDLIETKFEVTDITHDKRISTVVDRGGPRERRVMDLL